VNIVEELVYGDIHEVPIRLLTRIGLPEYSNADIASMDEEQKTRLAAAATVLKWIYGCDCLDDILCIKRRCGHGH